MINDKNDDLTSHNPKNDCKKFNTDINDENSKNNRMIAIDIKNNSNSTENICSKESDKSKIDIRDESTDVNNKNKSKADSLIKRTNISTNEKMSGEKIDSNRQNENLKLLPNNELENFDILNDKLDYGPTGISPRCRVSSFDNNEFDPEDFSAYMNGRRTLLGDSEEIDLNIYGEIDDAPKGETSNNYEYDAILDSNNFGYENLDNEEIYK